MLRGQRAADERGGSGAAKYISLSAHPPIYLPPLALTPSHNDREGSDVRAARGPGELSSREWVEVHQGVFSFEQDLLSPPTPSTRALHTPRLEQIQLREVGGYSAVE